MATRVKVKGFVVGRGAKSYYADGSSWSRPKLIEVEAGSGEVAVAIDDGIVWLDGEATAKLRDILNDAIEAVS